MTDVHTPGQLITLLLAKKGWSQRTLARIMDVGESRLTRVITDKQAVDAEFALLLQDVFGAPAEQFLALQANTDLAFARQTRIVCPELAGRMRLYGDLPISEMIKRGWLAARALHDTEGVEASLLKLFGVDCAERIDDVLGKVTCDDESRKNITHLAWLCRLGQIAASGSSRRSFSPQALQASLPKLRSRIRSRDDVADVPSILEDCGVRFALIEPLKGGDLDGGCLWLGDHTPAIALSMRHDRLDYFWLVLRHQLEHILRREGTGPFLDVDLDRSLDSQDYSMSAGERAANDAAHEFCLPSEQVDEFLSTTGPIVTERDIIEGATKLDVHPCILVGEVSRRVGRQNCFRRYAPKVRAHLAANATVDGWGWHGLHTRSDHGRAILPSLIGMNRMERVGDTRTR